MVSDKDTRRMRTLSNSLSLSLSLSLKDITYPTANDARGGDACSAHRRGLRSELGLVATSAVLDRSRVGEGQSRARVGAEGVTLVALCAKGGGELKGARGTGEIKTKRSDRTR